MPITNLLRKKIKKENPIPNNFIQKVKCLVIHLTEMKRQKTSAMKTMKHQMKK